MNYLNSRSKLFCLGLIIILGGTVYLNAIPNDFVWDDKSQIVENILIRNWYNLPLLFQSGTFYSPEEKPPDVFYRPIMFVSYMLNYSIFGLKSFGFHLFQIFFHLLNSILVFFILDRILSLAHTKLSRAISFLSAVIFVLHPANVESVAFIGSISEVLYTFFGLFSILILILGLDWQNKVIKNKFLFLSLLLAFFSLLSKETAIVVFGVSFLYLVIIFRPKFNQYLKWCFGSAIIVIAYFVLRFAVAKIHFARGHLSPIAEASFIERILTIPYEAFYYLKTIFFPLYLSISQQFVVSSLKDFRFYGSVLLLISILSVTGFFLWKTKSKIYFFFLLWFFGSLAPVLNIVPLGMTVAERWLYFPMIGATSLICSFFVGVEEKIKRKKRIFVCFLLAFIFIIFGARTIIRNRDWKDDLTLCSHDIKYSRQSSELENNYGVALIQIERYKEAEDHLKRAIEIQGLNPYPYGNMGIIYTEVGEIDKAKEYYYKSIERGNIYGVYENMGSILVQQGKWDEAEDFLSKAISKFPKDPNLKWLLSLVFRQRGQIDKAKDVLEEALKDDPKNEIVIYFLQSLGK